MKRLTIWQKLHGIRIARARLRRRLQSRQSLSAGKRNPEMAIRSTKEINPANSPRLHQISIYRRGTIHRGWARDRVAMPENFCLVDNYEAVADFLGELRRTLALGHLKLERYLIEGGSRRALNWKRSIVDSYVDFSSLKRITPVTALVLASEYDRAKSLSSYTDWLRAIDVEHWDPQVSQTLDDVGFLSLLGVDKQASLAERDGIFTVPFLSGSKVYGATIDKLIRAMAALADSSGVHDSETLLSRSRVYDGLGEAVQNVEDHAYPDGAFADERLLAKKWWMTGAVEPIRKRFTVAIYDHGISIPASLPRWTRFDEFKSSFAGLAGLEYDTTSTSLDGDAIAHAVQLGRSSTGEDWHGKGLPVIRNIIENCKGGTVRILSRNGQYVCAKGQKAHYISNKCPIAGTLVEWELLL
jgi:hypothetical protein